MQRSERQVMLDVQLDIRSGKFSCSHTCVPGSVSGPRAVINTSLLVTKGERQSIARCAPKSDLPKAEILQRLETLSGSSDRLRLCQQISMIHSLAF